MNRPPYVPTCQCYKLHPEQRDTKVMITTPDMAIDAAEEYAHFYAASVRGPVYLFRTALSF